MVRNQIRRNGSVCDVGAGLDWRIGRLWNGSRPYIHYDWEMIRKCFSYWDLSTQGSKGIFLKGVEFKSLKKRSGTLKKVWGCKNTSLPWLTLEKGGWRDTEMRLERILIRDIAHDNQDQYILMMNGFCASKAVWKDGGRILHVPSPTGTWMCTAFRERGSFHTCKKILVKIRLSEDITWWWTT